MTNTNLISFARTKSPGLVKTPADMLQLGGLQYAINKDYIDEYSNFGHVKYFSIDEAESSKKDWGKDFGYFINDMGFRGTYPNPADKNLLAFFGCSITFGIGVPDEELYSNLVAGHFNKQCLNLGIPGSNIHRTALVFSAATQVWDIETAVINLPPFTRLHYVDIYNHIHSILLGYKIELPDLEAVRNDILKDFSDQYLLAQAIDAVQWMIDVAKARKINLVLASWDPDTTELINAAFNTNLLKFDIVDHGRDQHPGEISHRQFADKVIKTLTSETYTC